MLRQCAKHVFLRQNVLSAMESVPVLREIRGSIEQTHFDQHQTSSKPGSSDSREHANILQLGESNLQGPGLCSSFPLSAQAWSHVKTATGQRRTCRSPSTAFHLHSPGSIWNTITSSTCPAQLTQVRFSGALSRVRVPKSASYNDNIMGNLTDLKHGMYGIRACEGGRVAANTIETMRRTLRRKLKKSAALWIKIKATVPVTRKPLGIRMGKGKGYIEFYACPVRPGQIICEMDRVPRKVALSALEALQPKFPCRLGFVEWS